ncbi:hypothetical protein [Paenibacillus aceris]|uniref:DUF4259 domain-containing protein n=1 Tax=Paenibacillus aceris TaxID=869555 RepID=A0ABS4I837_9BACL|nr:hypothetical protein [Paenibacillus aceris]MBP1967097.1 hypothetical protein [Paenibacillus aceris]NHW35513.1 hypothetical protein [Paenibacillus aceris]
MGAWGTAIFSDDLASDIKDEFRELIAEGHDGETATNIVVENWKSELEDYEVRSVFWLSLALEIIISGEDLKRWEEEPKLLIQRKKVLEKLMNQLNQPQCEPKKIPKRFIAQTDFERGDAIGYKLLSGKYIILKVITVIEQHSGDRYPLFELCNWVSTEFPDKIDIGSFNLLEWTFGNGKKELKKLAIFPSGKKDYPFERITVIAKNVPIQLSDSTPYMLLAWKQFDDDLRKFYNLE